MDSTHAPPFVTFQRSFSCWTVVFGLRGKRTARGISSAAMFWPILSDRLLSLPCPDAEPRGPNLRLDQPRIGESTTMAATCPRPEREAKLLTRITSDDPDLLMPPRSHIARHSPAPRSRICGSGSRTGRNGGSTGRSKTQFGPRFHRFKINPIDAMVRKRLSNEGTEPFAEAD